MARRCPLGAYRHIYGICDHRFYGGPHFFTYYAGVRPGWWWWCFGMVVLASANYADFSPLSDAFNPYGMAFWSI